MERTDRSYSEGGFNVSCVSDLSGVSPIGTGGSSEWRSLQVVLFVLESDPETSKIP